MVSLAKLFMRVFGVVFVLIGVGGFFLPMDGALGGLLHLSTPHNLIHLISGIIFLVVSGRDDYSKLVAKIFGLVYLLVAILGLFMDNIFGLVMVTPAIEVIHFLVALLALVVGFTNVGSSTDKNMTSKM